MACASLAGQIYSKQLYTLGLGLPQWHPEAAVKLGDVGFYLGDVGGPFFKLHNIFDSPEGQPNGVPDGFQPLQLPRALIATIPCERNAQTLSSLSVRRTEIGTGVSS